MSERTTEPTQISQGERIEWTKSLCDFPATEWTLVYRIRGVGPGVDVTCTPDGDDHVAVITAAASVLFGVGAYQWQSWLTEIGDATNTVQLSDGSLNVKRGFVFGETGDIDLRSDAQIMLDAIDAALLAFATSDVMEYEISTPSGSRRVKRSDKTQLTEQRKYWAAIVMNEKAKAKTAAGGSFGTQVDVRFFDV